MTGKLGWINKWRRLFFLALMIITRGKVPVHHTRIILANSSTCWTTSFWHSKLLKSLSQPSCLPLPLCFPGLVSAPHRGYRVTPDPSHNPPLFWFSVWPTPLKQLAFYHTHTTIKTYIDTAYPAHTLKNRYKYYFVNEQKLSTYTRHFTIHQQKVRLQGLCFCWL